MKLGDALGVSSMVARCTEADSGDLADGLRSETVWSSRRRSRKAVLRTAWTFNGLSSKLYSASIRADDIGEVASMISHATTRQDYAHHSTGGAHGSL